jgi:hypothetical protein
MHDALVETAKAYAKGLERTLGKVSVVLYGSVARGDFNRSSDIDVLVVSDNLPKRFLDRLSLLMGKADAGIEPKGYTVSEFKTLVKKKSFAFMLSDRIVLVDDLGLFQVTSPSPRQGAANRL